MIKKQFTFKEYEPEQIPDNMIKVRFTKYVPKFIGTDYKHYGHFNIGTVSIIPKLNAKGLLNKQACIEVK